MTKPENTSSVGTRAESIDAMLADIPKADDHDGVRDYLHALAAHGCAPLFIHPGSKVPADCRTIRKRNADDKAAQMSAWDAGRRNYSKIKSPAGLALATTDTAILDGYLDQYVKTYGDAVAVNLAVEVGGSRLVVVDCDTADQMAAFLADADAPDGTPPTVCSPGVFDANTGEWKHRDGGHFYFTVPDGVELPENPGTMTDTGGGYAVLWNRRYVLTPPSVRAEGSYTVTGHVHDLPEWLRDRIIEHGQKRAAHALQFTGDGNGSSRIEAWGMTITWAEILGNVPGWVRTGGVDSCGCDVWTAPGDHASAKSATAHEWGCGKWETPDPPLHLWTDHPGETFASHVRDTGKTTISRLQAVALIDFDDDMGAAMDALDLHDDLSFDVVTGSTGSETASGDPHDVELLEEIVAYSPVTAHIVEQARARLIGPWALLGISLVRASLLIPYWVTLPGIVGSRASMNLLGAFVGASGAGKGVATGADDYLSFDLPVPNPHDEDGAWFLQTETGTQDPATAHRPAQVGSGEAISALFRDWRKVHPVEDPHKSVSKIVTVGRARWVDFAEVDSFASLMRKESSQFSAELRRVFDGRELGSFTKTHELRTSVEAFTYRCAVTVSVQPEHGGPILDSATGGLPQRMFWIATDDPSAPDTQPARCRLDVSAPPWVPGDIPVATEIAAEIVAARRKVLRSESGALTGLDAHRNLVRLKMSAAIAALHSRAEITTGDWHLAAVVLEHSDRVRHDVQSSLAEAGRQLSAARGAADAHRGEGARIEEAARVTSAVESVRQWVEKQSDPFTARDVARSGKKGSPRAIYAEQALNILVEESVVEICGETRSKTAIYRQVAAAGSPQ